MPFLEKGKTDWKRLLLVVILAFAFIVLLWRSAVFMKKKGPVLFNWNAFPKITQEEKEEIERFLTGFYQAMENMDAETTMGYFTPPETEEDKGTFYWLTGADINIDGKFYRVFLRIKTSNPDIKRVEKTGENYFRAFVTQERQGYDNVTASWSEPFKEEAFFSLVRKDGEFMIEQYMLEGLKGKYDGFGQGPVSSEPMNIEPISGPTNENGEADNTDSYHCDVSLDIEKPEYQGLIDEKLLPEGESLSYSIKEDLDGDGIPENISIYKICNSNQFFLRIGEIYKEVEDVWVGGFLVVDIDTNDGYKEVFVHNSEPSDVYIAFSYDGKEIKKMARLTRWPRIHGSGEVDVYNWVDCWHIKEKYVLNQETRTLDLLPQELYDVNFTSGAIGRGELFAEKNSSSTVVYTIKSGDHVTVEKAFFIPECGDHNYVKCYWYFVSIKGEDIQGWMDWRVWHILDKVVWAD